MSKWFHPGKDFLPNHEFNVENCLDRTCAAFRFEMAVDTDSIHHNAYLVTCDTCQATEVKGYMWVFTCVGVGLLMHLLQTALPLQVIGQRVRTISYINKEVLSLECMEVLLMHYFVLFLP